MKGACISTVMDRGTRFCLSILVSPTKDGQNSAELFESARQMAGHAPLVTISDALDAIRAGHREAFGREECSIHVRETHIRNQRANNNGHERFNLTLSDMLPRRKARMTGSVLQAGWLYYNFLRPHMSLAGAPPQKGRHTHRTQGQAAGPHTERRHVWHAVPVGAPSGGRATAPGISGRAGTVAFPTRVLPRAVQEKANPDASRGSGNWETNRQC